MTTPRSSATDSALGFLYQGQYALVLLWDADEDDAVSIETQDDVVLEGNDVTLHQLKHSQGTPPDLKITNAGFWKTLRIWSEHLRAELLGTAETFSAGRSARYCFVTVATVGSDDPLALIRGGVARSPDSDSIVVAALTEEAERIESVRAAARAAGETEPYADRAAGCAAFLSLTPEHRAFLVGRMTILDGQFRIADVADQVANRLKNYVHRERRLAVTERLISWWDRQAALALMSRRSRRIAKSELTGAVHDFIAEHRVTTLTDNFSWRTPEDEELSADRGGNIERQISLVRGGSSRVERALVARWRARAQRRAWTEYDVSITGELDQFDDRLKEAWADRHGPLRDDCVGLSEDDVCIRGRDLLDWAHVEAPQQVPPPRPDWNRPFYAQGVLQQFADDLEVGWHPEFRSLLASEDQDSALPGEGTVGEPAGGRRRVAPGAGNTRKTRRAGAESTDRTGRGRKKSPQKRDAP